MTAFFHAINRRRRRAVSMLAGCCLAAPGLLHAASIVDSLHNLSAMGPGTIRAATESRICVFCHTPHGATSDAPLWNRYSSGATYIPYSSTTAKARIGQPTGASKLCLSCHDGTVALGLVRSHSATIPFAGGVYNMPPGRSNLGTDLAGDHPISFVYDSALAAENGELVDPGVLVGPVRLDRDRMLQCTSCHDPHNDQFGNFLVLQNDASALCMTCHVKDYWIDSIHRTSTATWNGQSVDPWPYSESLTVAANACESCHTSHDAGTKERLLIFAGEEQNCYSCHNGNVAGSDMQAEFSKASVHPIASTSGVHDPTEDPVDPPRHVECVDCHNPHAAKTQPASPPAAPGSLAGVRGIDASGSIVNPLANTYELCFRCHGDSLDRDTVLINRQFSQTNTRIEFSPANQSYHPILGVGKNPDVPSLFGSYSESSIITCTDCHSNDQGPGAGGGGPRGPHGSAYAPLLERQLEFSDYGSENSGVYALCYKCHSRTSILDNESFPYHADHIAIRGAACTTCHDPHGVESAPHLINFNLDYVSANGNGSLEFIDGGFQTGVCSLTCHGIDHDAVVYPIIP